MLEGVWGGRLVPKTKRVCKYSEYTAKKKFTTEIQRAQSFQSIENPFFFLCVLCVSVVKIGCFPIHRNAFTISKACEPGRSVIARSAAVYRPIAGRQNAAVALLQQVLTRPKSRPPTNAGTWSGGGSNDPPSHGAMGNKRLTRCPRRRNRCPSVRNSPTGQAMFRGGRPTLFSWESLPATPARSPWSIICGKGIHAADLQPPTPEPMTKPVGEFRT